LQPPLLQIQQSQTRYTSADFVAQARALRSTAFKEVLAGSPGVGAVGTPAGLTACLSAIGAGRAEVVRADLAFYEGQPAVIIVTTSHGIPTAYALGRGCTGADGAVLRPATPLR
jgi:hypothetical protein